jgi:hypothetical protein
VVLYLVGRTRIFPKADCLAIQRQYAKFPKVWEVIEVNFDTAAHAGLRSDVQAFVRALERFDWLPEVGGAIDSESMSGLGLAPLIVLGLVAAAAALGIGGAIYGIGYIKEQNNQADLIREVVQGTIPADVLRADVEAENQTILGSIADIGKWAAIAGAVYLAWQIWQSFRKAGGEAE